MTNRTKIDYLLSATWIGWRRWVAWSVSICVIFLLGALRVVTDAEFAFASLALIPVLAIAWFGGKAEGLVLALLAAVMWSLSEIASDQQFSAPWIPWANAVTRFITYSLVAVLTAQVRLQFIRERKHATRDELTGLLNRRAFLEAGTDEVDRSKRYAHPLAVAFLDLDTFKQLNDTKGHDTGDSALRATAKALVGALRSSDRVARLGGDEFAILLPEIGYEEAVEAGHKIFNAVNSELRGFPPVQGSLGVAWFEKSDRTLSEMLKEADRLMYEVKESGKNDIRTRRFSAMNDSDHESKEYGN
jgi:diguanylate cyclase (GGDEF)-like protein